MEGGGLERSREDTSHIPSLTLSRGLNKCHVTEKARHGTQANSRLYSVFCEGGRGGFCEGGRGGFCEGGRGEVEEQ